MKYICIVFKNLSVNAWKAVVHAQFCPVTGTRPTAHLRTEGQAGGDGGFPW